MRSAQRLSVRAHERLLDPLETGDELGPRRRRPARAASRCRRVRNTETTSDEAIGIALTPTSIRADAINLPGVVSGTTSPYPTVVTVTIAHQSALPNPLIPESTMQLEDRGHDRERERDRRNHPHGAKQREPLDTALKPVLEPARHTERFAHAARLPCQRIRAETAASCQQETA